MSRTLSSGNTLKQPKQIPATKNVNTTILLFRGEPLFSIEELTVSTPLLISFPAQCHNSIAHTQLPNVLTTAIIIPAIPIEPNEDISTSFAPTSTPKNSNNAYTCHVITTITSGSTSLRKK